MEVAGSFFSHSLGWYSAGPQRCMKSWPLGLVLEVLGHDVAYCKGPGRACKLEITHSVPRCFGKSWASSKVSRILTIRPNTEGS